MTKTTRGRYTSIIIAVLIILLTFAPWMKVSPMGTLLEFMNDSDMYIDSFLESMEDGRSVNLWESIKIVGAFDNGNGYILGTNATMVTMLFGWGAIAFAVVNLIFVIVSLVNAKNGKSFCTFTMVSCIFYCLCYGLTVLGINDAFHECFQLNMESPFSMTIIPFVEIFLLVLMRYFQVPAEAVAEPIVENKAPAVEEKTEKAHFCPICGTENKKEAKFCQNCGGMMKKKKTCPVCNTELEENATFCINCGTKA